MIQAENAAPPFVRQALEQAPTNAQQPADIHQTPQLQATAHDTLHIEEVENQGMKISS